MRPEDNKCLVIVKRGIGISMQGDTNDIYCHYHVGVSNEAVERMTEKERRAKDVKEMSLLTLFYYTYSNAPSRHYNTHKYVLLEKCLATGEEKLIHFLDNIREAESGLEQAAIKHAEEVSTRMGGEKLRIVKKGC